MDDYKKDFYLKEDRGHWSEPCDTCKHRRMDIEDPLCPCLRCEHYAQ